MQAIRALSSRNWPTTRRSAASQPECARSVPARAHVGCLRAFEALNCLIWSSGRGLMPLDRPWQRCVPASTVAGSQLPWWRCVPAMEALFDASTEQRAITVSNRRTSRVPATACRGGVAHCPSSQLPHRVGYPMPTACETTRRRVLRARTGVSTEPSPEALLEAGNEWVRSETCNC